MVTPAVDGGSLPAAVGSYRVRSPGDEVVIAPAKHTDLCGLVNYPDASDAAVGDDFQPHIVNLSDYYHRLEKRIHCSMISPLRRIGGVLALRLDHDPVRVLFSP